MADILPSELDIVAGDNTTVPDGTGGSVNVAENCAAGGLNNAIRSLAACIAAGWGGMYSGSTRPSAVRANSFWLNTSSSKVLTFYDGTTDIPWVTFDGGDLTPVPEGQQVLTSGTTYTPPTGCRAIEVTCVGGGGGGGGSGASGATTTAIGGGGGGGGLARKFISSLESSYTYAIGAAGTGGAAGVNAGSSGGNTTFSGGSVSLSAGGGTGGTGGTATVGTLLGVGVSGGAASGGDINIPGNASGNVAAVSGDAISIPSSGASPLGGGSVQPASTDTNGTTATAPGAGGGGGIAQDGSTGRAGGDGAAGLIIIREFY